MMGDKDDEAIVPGKCVETNTLRIVTSVTALGLTRLRTSKLVCAFLSPPRKGRTLPHLPFKPILIMSFSDRSQ